MAGFMSSDVGSAAERFAASLANFGQTIYDVEAENEARSANLAIADDIERFKESLWQDADYGTPGQNDGYMKKWNDFLDGGASGTGLKATVLGSMKNAKAKEKVTDFIAQTAIQQRSQVAELQFRRWAEGTVSASGKRVNELLDKGGLSVQAKLDAAHAEYDYLRGHNLISAETYQEKMAAASQIAIRRDLSARAKAAYQAGGLSAAERVIADDQTPYSAGGGSYFAGDSVKALAQQDLKLFDSTIQATADAAMQDAWANLVRVGTGRGEAQGDILSIELIQGYTTPDGFAMDAKGKEYWTGRLLSFDNGQKTGAGSLDSANANLFLGQAEKIAGAVREQKGGIRADSASIRLWNPKTNEYETMQVSESALRAYMKSDDFTKAMDAGGKEAWAAANKLLEELAKPVNAWDTIRNNTVMPATKKMGTAGATLLAEFDAAMTAHADWGPEQIGKFVETDILGKAYKTTIAEVIDFAPGRYDNLDDYAFDAWDGRFSGAVVDGKITNPLYKSAIDGNTARIQKGLAPIVGETIARVDDRGNTWFIGRVDKAGPLPAQREGKQLGTAKAVNYTVAPIADGTRRNAQVLRDIEYAANLHVKQMNVFNGKDYEWVDVFLAPGGDRFQMSPTDAARIIKAREGKAAELDAKTQEQQRKADELWLKEQGFE